MNEEAGIKGFLSDYKCYISYLKDCIDGGIDICTFAEFCKLKEYVFDNADMLDEAPDWLAKGMGW